MDHGIERLKIINWGIRRRFEPMSKEKLFLTQKEALDYMNLLYKPKTLEIIEESGEKRMNGYG